MSSLWLRNPDAVAAAAAAETYNVYDALCAIQFPATAYSIGDVLAQALLGMLAAAKVWAILSAGRGLGGRCAAPKR